MLGVSTHGAGPGTTVTVEVTAMDCMGSVSRWSEWKTMGEEKVWR
jgi:hypothetical protein